MREGTPVFYLSTSDDQPPVSTAPSTIEPVQVFLKTKKKYKPVAKKVRPVVDELPAHFRIVRNRIGDPLEGMPVLDPNPAPYVPTNRYTQDQ